MKELTVTFNNLLQDKRVRSEQSKYELIQRQRASVINKYKRAYQEFLDLEAGLQGAKGWYAEMRETVDSLEKNIETFVNNRRSEGAALLSQIEQDMAASKNAQAAMEQERLRGLMERMSMEPPTSPARPPVSARPVPTPLSFTTPTTRYPPTNFAGQYQVPNSPPPVSAPYSVSNQATVPVPYSPQSSQPYNQPSYNPSTYGRNPGPVSPPPTQTTFGVAGLRQGPASPPPTQTSFGVGGLRPGPSSPPPTQTTFSQPNRPFSTYGNPAAAQQQQQQVYVPPGFVPPPPPPGPPPLGPQQTFHFSSTEYGYGSGPQSARPGSSQQQHPSQHPVDPWAGLNAWK